MTRDEELYVRQQAGEPNKHVRDHIDHCRLSEIMRVAHARGRSRARVAAYGRRVAA